MNLPIDFISTIKNTFGEDGEQFLANLPALIDEASARWGLTNIQPVENLSYNFVAYANLTSPPAPLLKGEGSVVLKIGVPRDELASEIAALRLFNGEGACQLIDADEERGFLLLERLSPGVMLSTLADDDEATHIAAEVMKRIWRPKEHVTLSGAKSLRDDGRDPSGREASLSVTHAKFIQLPDWFDQLQGVHEMVEGGTSPFDEKLVERVERSTKEFFAENHQPVLMHGDFHHYNILSSERGWLVIDPKGVIGPACYEVGPLMMNPWGELPRGINFKVRMKRRIDILHEHLGFERERIREWSLAHAILSAWWDYPNLHWEYSMEVAELISAL